MFTVAMQVFKPSKLGAAMGMCALVIMFAPAVGPTITGLILAKLNWHWLFWLFIPVLLIALVFAITSLENVGNITSHALTSCPLPDPLSGLPVLFPGSAWLLTLAGRHQLSLVCWSLP